MPSQPRAQAGIADGEGEEGEAAHEEDEVEHGRRPNEGSRQRGSWVHRSASTDPPRRRACRDRQNGRTRRRNARGRSYRFHKDLIRIGPVWRGAARPNQNARSGRLRIGARARRPPPGSASGGTDRSAAPESAGSASSARRDSDRRRAMIASLRPEQTRKAGSSRATRGTAKAPGDGPLERTGNLETAIDEDERDAEMPGCEAGERCLHAARFDLRDRRLGDAASPLSPRDRRADRGSESGRLSISEAARFLRPIEDMIFAARPCCPLTARWPRETLTRPFGIPAIRKKRGWTVHMV